MIILFFHLSFLLKTYKNIESSENLQKFFDYCVKQIELSIREIGYGDATINKKMKDYINLLFSIIDKIDTWDYADDIKKKEIIVKYINDNEKVEKYLNYFDKYCKYLRKNTFNSLSKDIITL